MSAVVRTRRGKHKSLSTTALWLVLGLAAIFFLVIYGQQLLLEHSIKEQIAAQRFANASLRDSNTRLKVALQYYQSDKYVEQRAREDLNLRRGDEEVLIPVHAAPPSQDQATQSDQVPSEQSTTTAEMRAEKTQLAEVARTLHTCARHALTCIRT
jgi:cell division protein FtsB